MTSLLSQALYTSKKIKKNQLFPIKSYVLPQLKINLLEINTG